MLKHIINSIKFFLFYNIKKESLFFNNVSTLNQLIFFYFYLFILLLFLLDLVTYKKFIYFLLLWILLLIYKIIVDIILYYAMDNIKLKVFIETNDKIFSQILHILLFIQKWKNPLLVLLLYIDKLLYKFLRVIIYKLKNNKLFNYNKSNLKNIVNLQYFLLNIFLGPLKLILGFFYKMLYNLAEMPFILFLLIRSFGFVLNILIISHLLKYLYDIFGIKIYIFFYICLIFINIFIKIIDKDFKYFKFKNFILFNLTDYLIFLRNSSTICGLIILNINLYKKKKINIQYIDIFSSHLRIDIEENFSKYWIFYKKNVLLCKIEIWKEIKNRPSWYIYQNFMCWINVVSTFELNGPSFIINLLYILYKVKKLNIKLPVDIKQNIDYLYKIDLLRLKLLLYMIWDIDNYIGNKNLNYITSILDEYMFNIGCKCTLYDYIDVDNFKVEENEKDLPFYDPENNMEFFNKLYKIICMPTFLEYPLHLKIFSKSLENYICLKKDLLKNLTNLYSDDPLATISLDHTWIRIVEEDISDIDGISLIEYEIKDWIDIFIKESREEWDSLIKKESIEERNWRLLKEIEDMLLKK